MRLLNDRYSQDLFALNVYINHKKETKIVSSKKTKEKLRNLQSGYAKSNSHLLIERWDIQERKLKTGHLGLAQFLNKHFTIKTVNIDNTENSGANAR